MCAAWLRVVPRKPGGMRADSASHLLRQPVSFELFFFTYLVCALLLQKINIYKTVSQYLYWSLLSQSILPFSFLQNFHLVDFNLVLFTIIVLSRRLGWCVLQELQSHWPSVKKPLKSSSKGSRKWAQVFESMVNVVNVKHVMVVICTLLVILWSVVRLIEHTSLFNLLFLFYP